MFRNGQIVMVGAFPPPVHGMATVNAAVRQALQKIGVEPLVINVAAPAMNRSLGARLARLPKVIGGFMTLIGTRGLRNHTLYMSVSGGLGQVHEVALLLAARLRGMSTFLHHHSYAYLDSPALLTRILSLAAGPQAVHIALSPLMAERLGSVYGIQRKIAVSNAVFFATGDPTDAPSRVRRHLYTLGFLSNISYEKGILEFLALLGAVQNAGLPLRGRLAGPFKDHRVERRVRAILATLPNVEYVGPKYGSDKDSFFASIDALVFPTRYVNEAEPLTVHEAMSNGIPVVAYGRGCISEIAGSDCGNVIDPSEPFVPAAMAQIRTWLDYPSAFEAACRAAARRFAKNHSDSEHRWQLLLSCLAGGGVDTALELSTGNKP